MFHGGKETDSAPKFHHAHAVSSGEMMRDTRRINDLQIPNFNAQPVLSQGETPVRIIEVSVNLSLFPGTPNPDWVPKPDKEMPIPRYNSVVISEDRARQAASVIQEVTGVDFTLTNLLPQVPESKEGQPFAGMLKGQISGSRCEINAAIGRIERGAGKLHEVMNALATGQEIKPVEKEIPAAPSFSALIGAFRSHLARHEQQVSAPREPVKG